MWGPIITTQLPWTRSLIFHKKNGYLIKPGDSDAIANSILELLSNEKLAREIGCSGRITVLKKYNDNTSEAVLIATMIKKVCLNL